LLIPERTLGLTPGAEASTPTHNASETTPPTVSAKSRPPACASEKRSRRAPQSRTSLCETKGSETKGSGVFVQQLRQLRLPTPFLQVRALQAAKWIIGGPAGAAAKLGMKRTTLQSKMQKFDISRPS